MGGAHMFQAIQHPELDTLRLVAIRDFLKKRARYLQLVAQNNKVDGVNVRPITVVTSIDPELLENLIDMEEVDAESVDDCTDESVMEYLESMQEIYASVTAEYVKAEVPAKVLFNMSEKDPALRATKAVADYYSLHRNLKLDFINGKPKKTVEHLVSVIKPATLKALIESKLELDMSELKKDFLEFVGYMKKMAIIHDEHCHVV
jgi:anion-transporting  ArsA/GET3 family ATPase